MAKNDSCLVQFGLNRKLILIYIIYLKAFLFQYMKLFNSSACHPCLQGGAFSSYSAQQLHRFFQLDIPVFGLLSFSFHLYTITPDLSLHSPSIPWCGGANANNPFSPAYLNSQNSVKRCTFVIKPYVAISDRIFLSF